MSHFEDWENIIHFWNCFGSIGKKTYFLALGTTPVKGVGFIAGKITDILCKFDCTILRNIAINIYNTHVKDYT